MDQNTYSLFEGPWLITDQAARSLVPAIISITKGNGIPLVKAEPQNITVFAEYDDDDDYDEYDMVDETRSDAKYIPVVSLKNPIYKYDQYCGPRGTQTIIAMLEKWRTDDSVMGVVFDFDSGGGQAAGTAELAKYISEYPKPTGAYTNGTICSAAYWIASACDFIIANENADFIGSIGTMIRYVNLEGILKAEGAVIEDIYASLSTRKNEESRQKENEDKNDLIITNILDPYNNRFHEGVKASRPQIDVECYTGATYLPAAALEKGLIDQIGTMNDAFDRIITESQSNSTSNKNQNSTKMSNTRTSLMAALALSAPLAETKEKGSYLNAEQLDTLEATLADNASALTQAQTDLQAANGKATTAETKLTDANTATTAQLDALLTSSGLPVTGNTEEKFTALANHLAVVNKGDGAKHTDPKVDNGKETENSTVIHGIDAAGAFNC